MGSPLNEAALNLARSDVGKEEQPRGTNWGPYVQSLLAKVGINFPASWCMAFVYSKFDEACTAIGTINPLFKTGGVLAMWNKCPQARVPTPVAGDVLIMDFGNGAGHTGFVEHVDENTVYTIEGNSNNNGSREGFAVVRRARARTDPRIKGYLRF